MSNQASEDKTDKTVHIDICTGASGECVYVNDYRVKGGKPWGGGTITKSIEIKTDELLRAIESEVQALIRTEKLKLLAEVRERVVGEDKPLQGKYRASGLMSYDMTNHYENSLRAEQRAVLTQLEAEL